MRYPAPARRAVAGLKGAVRSLMARVAARPGVKRSARVVRVRPPHGKAWGRALQSYLAAPASWSERDRRMRGHTNNWESREITRLLSDLGLEVDVIDFDDEAFVPDGHYEVVLAIHSELDRLAEQADARVRLMHHTGAYPSFQNAAELRRIEELFERRGVRCIPRRQVDEGPVYDRALEEASACSLLGNGWTVSTFPREARSKIACIPATGSQLPRIRSEAELVPARREFLWYFGSGAVHKGLDRTLEAFARTPRLVLHVVGNVGDEEDFMAAYRHELFELPNIRWHGFLDPHSRRFRRLVRGCFCVIAPTCSEGTSPATITMLQLGLFPLISRECGITLPTGAGRYLNTCGVEEIEAAILELRDMPEPELREQTRLTQAMALSRHSRESFRREFGDYLREAVRSQPVAEAEER